MGLIDDVNNDAWLLNCDPDLMPGAESAVYRPRGGGAQDVPVNVQVTRHLPEGLPGFSNGQSVTMVTVFLPAGQGVSSIDTGGDVIVLPHQIGSPPRPIPVREIVAQDNGGWTLALY